MRIARRSPHDREIVRLAVPAFGALVGRAALPAGRHRDRRPPRHPTARRPRRRRHGAHRRVRRLQLPRLLAPPRRSPARSAPGDRRAAAEFGVDGCWLAVGLGARAHACSGSRSRRHRRRDGRVGTACTPFAVTYLRISILGAPALLLALAGAGLPPRHAGHAHHARDRGRRQHREPAARALSSSTALDLGLAGSAWGTVLAQFGAATAYLVVVARGRGASGASVAARARGHPRQRRRREPARGADRVAARRAPHRDRDRGALR